MSRSEHPDDGDGPHGPDTEHGKIVARRIERLDFEAARDINTTSWERADPKQELKERWGRYGYLVTLPDGDAHFLVIGRRNGEIRGFSKCKGFRHHAGAERHQRSQEAGERTEQARSNHATRHPRRRRWMNLKQK